MALAAFDTLEFVDELEKSGVPEKQARAISSAVRKVHESSDVATKQDVTGLEQRVDSKFEALRHEIGDLRKDMDAKHESLRKDIFHEIRELESRLLVKLTGIVIGAVTIIPFALKYLHVG